MRQYDVAILDYCITSIRSDYAGGCARWSLEEARKNLEGSLAERVARDLYVSADVLDEAERGDSEAARLRVKALDECRVLAATEQAQLLTKQILATGLIPPRAATDAAHIGLAAAHGMDFLLTWNCRHIHNSFIERRLAGVCHDMGLTLPVLCTPRELIVKLPGAIKTENPIEEIWIGRIERFFSAYGSRAPFFGCSVFLSAAGSVGCMARAHRLKIDGGIFYVTHRCHNRAFSVEVCTRPRRLPLDASNRAGRSAWW